MLTRNSLLVALTLLLCLTIKSSDAVVSCTHCPSTIPLNVTSDADINVQQCNLIDANICMLEMNIDYDDANISFALLQGTSTPILVLTNGEAQVSETISVWFDQVRVQRTANILCFVGTSCGVDLLKKIYKDEVRTFDYRAIQSKLASLLYDSTSANATLTCEDSTGNAISCPNGFCRSVVDGNGYTTYSTCLTIADITPSYGLIAQKAKIVDLGGEQASIIFTCNKPMCNSKDSAQQVLQLLAAAGVIPQPVTTTTANTPASSTPNLAVGMKNEQQYLLLSVILLSSIFNVCS